MNGLDPLFDLEKDEAEKFRREVQGDRDNSDSDAEFGPTPMIQPKDFKDKKVISELYLLILFR